MKNNIVVVGGGTAGWLTALFLNSIFTDKKIILIQSTEVGIIGVGEATTPHLVKFLQSLHIDIFELIKFTKGTIKNGISFENWNGDGKKYFHNFSENVTNIQIKRIFGRDCNDFFLKNLISNNLPLEEYLYQTKLAHSNKIDLERTGWALHFDAGLLAVYLENIGKKRGITVINSRILSFQQKDNGFIEKILLENQQQINCDFVFDCSGFSRLIIGKLYKDKWNSFSKYLPMKKGITFWLDHTDNIFPYTKSIAMKNGWIWQIPLQHRIGSGYIFDSDRINEEQALSESEKYFGQSLKIKKVIDFEAGRYENFWIKNCIAVGLSSSFIEPLESTSLWLTVAELDLFKHFVNEIDNPNLLSVNLFNEVVRNNMDDILNFIYLHYLTKREDSEFWKTFKLNYPAPEKFKDMLEVIKNGEIRYLDFMLYKNTANFSLYSYLQVCHGLDLLNKKTNIGYYKEIVPNLNDYKVLIDRFIREAITHEIFLNSL